MRVAAEEVVCYWCWKSQSEVPVKDCGALVCGVDVLGLSLSLRRNHDHRCDPFVFVVVDP